MIKLVARKDQDARKRGRDKMRDHNQKLFLSLFIYNEQTGSLTWAKNGSEVGWIQNGYKQTEIDGLKYAVHRIIWVIMTGEWPERKIDHRDRDRINNRWSNLRLANDTDNARNKSLHNNNKSGFTGVSWNKRDQKWIAHITINYKTIKIGQFDNIEDAIAARLTKQTELFGNFSVGN